MRPPAVERVLQCLTCQSVQDCAIQSQPLAHCMQTLLARHHQKLHWANCPHSLTSREAD